MLNGQLGGSRAKVVALRPVVAIGCGGIFAEGAVVKVWGDV